MMKEYWKKGLSAALICSMLATASPVWGMAEGEQAPTEVPQATPYEAPTKESTQAPTEAPTQAPTEVPTQAPTEVPTQAPAEAPTQAPTEESTENPTGEPTQAPTEAPTQVPSEESTENPTEEPTQAPTETPEAGVMLMSTTLLIAQPTDLRGFDFTGYEKIVVEVGGKISGGAVNLPVENHGEISGGTYAQNVVNADGAVISGGSFNQLVHNRSGATIRDGAFNLRLINEGVVENGSFIGYVPKDEKDETPARTVQLENNGEIKGGTFRICRVQNAAEGEIDGGSFAEAVILPDGTTVALDFENTHVKLKGGALYYRPLEIFAMLDEQKNEIVIMPLNPQEKLLGYALNVVRDEAQYEVSGEWTAAEDGYVHIPVAEEWLGGDALVTVGYLSSADAQEAAAMAEIALPGVRLELSVEVDYANETVTLRTAEQLGAGWKLTAVPLPQLAVDYIAVAAEEGSNVVELDWPEGASEMRCALSELGVSPDSALDGEKFGVQLQLRGADATSSEIELLTLPARAAFSGKATGLKGIFRGATELEISSADGIEMAMALPGTPSDQLKAGKLFSGLQEKTQYHIWVRDAATDTAFASRWKLAAATTTQAIADVSFSPTTLNVSWQPKPAAPALSFEGGRLSAADLNYHWMNEKGESGKGIPEAPGNYQIICSLSESKAKWYRLRNDALQYNVLPLEINLANTRVRCENLTYNGKEQLPQNISVTVNGTEIALEEFSVEKISGQNYSQTGVKKLRLKGKGNVTGSIEFSYTIYASSIGSTWGSVPSGSGEANENEVEGEESGVEQIDYVSDNGERLVESYLGVGSDLKQALIVYDALDEAQDYEFLPVYNARENGDDVENMLIVTAQPDAEGEILSRTLRLGLNQIKRLHQEGGFDLLMLRNGDGESYLRLEELLSGDAAKLTMLMLVTQAEEIDLAELNFDALVETQLADEQLSQVNLELCIEPVFLSDELCAWKSTAWLCKGDLRVDVSALLPGFMVGMNVNGLFENGEEASFAAEHALALVNLQAQQQGAAAEVLQLESMLELLPQAADADDVCQFYEVHMPTEADPEVLVDYTAQVDLEPYRNYSMTASYPGEGVYLVVSLDGEK